MSVRLTYLTRSPYTAFSSLIRFASFRMENNFRTEISINDFYQEKGCSSLLNFDPFIQRLDFCFVP